MSHAFKVGQLVRSKSRRGERTSGVYEIARLMPPAPDGTPPYRTKGQGGERVVTEREIERA